MSNLSNAKVGIFAVKKEHWSHFQEMMVDSDENYASWVEWNTCMQQVVAESLRSGTEATPVWIDLADFQMWCYLQKRPCDGAARSTYAALKLEEQDRKGQALN